MLWYIKLCKCEINKIMHFNIIIISRAEDIHQILKNYLKFFIENLMTMINKLELMLMNQQKNYQMKFEQTKRRVSFAFTHSMFRNLLDRVASHVIWKINDQFERFQKITKKKSLISCIDVFFKIMKLSCNHMIDIKMKEKANDSKRILMKNIHSH